MEHFALHKNVTFEGYYSKFTLPSKASLILIVCSVPNARIRPHMVSVLYAPANEHPIYKREIYIDSLTFRSAEDSEGFELTVPNIGSIQVKPDSTTTYSFKHPTFTFEAKTTSWTSWSSRTLTPESWLIHFPLPLHWHAHSLASLTEFTLSLPSSANLAPQDRHGTAIVHQEKNWAHSFPSAHIWLQAYDPSTMRSICCAGGCILGMDAYLLGYRNAEAGTEIDFQPPFALKVLGFSPFMTAMPDWKSRSFSICVQNFRQKLSVRTWVDEQDWDKFFGLSAPFADGHRPNYLAANLRAKVEVVVSRRTGFFGFGGWEVVLEDGFESAALEFGSGYYPLRGQREKTD